MANAMPLHQLLDGFVPALPPINPMVRGMTADSRAVAEGDAFVALAGATTHGLRFAAQAAAAKAAVILFEPPAPDAMTLPGNVVAIDGLRDKVGRLAARFFGEPSRHLMVTAVTGTNGKTSTVQLIAQALSSHDLIVGTIGTLGAGIHGRLVAGERTTPDVISVHRLLAEMRAAGATQVAMEVSSHALAQSRVDAVAFDVAVFTNLTRDHLDFHGTMQAYGEAKASLFAWPGLRAAVINVDDAFGVSLLARLDAGVRPIAVSSRGHADATLRAESLHLSSEGIAFELVEGSVRAAVSSSLLGRFNVDNLLAVAGVLRAQDWSLADIAAALAKLQPVGGRMSRIGGREGQPLLVVDYAHTPDALEQALSSLRAHASGRLTCVFGCGGDRDRGKRPQMATVAQAGADRVIVTDDNPRHEDGDAIVAEIMAGFPRPESVEVERDRARAIALALRGAAGGDVILIAGKGHEDYQEVAGRKTPFDDRAVASAALAVWAGEKAA